MALNDPIADLLTRIRNAQMAFHEKLEVSHSRTKEAIVKILSEEGFVQGYTVDESGAHKKISVLLKYQEDRRPAIRSLRRVSRPGCRVYAGKGDIPVVLGGMGVSILSTSRGVLSGRQARETGVGGEILCEVY